ncbi:MAG: hypothetical protein ACC642_00550 [Pseudomonadales bacterium]
MTRSIATTIALIFVLGYSGAIEANRSGESYSLCQRAAISTHGEDTKVTLKRLRERREKTEVKLKVTTEDDSFLASCVVAHDGSIEYTPNNDALERIVVIEN